MKVLVVGAAGFVGRRLVEALHARAPGAVIAGVRSARACFTEAGIEQRVFDARVGADTSAALDDVTHVVNCVMGNTATMIETTRTLSAVAARVRIGRLVHFSSIAVFGDARGTIGDTHAFGADLDAYGAAKAECETIVDLARAAGLETVVLRPALIYGPGSQPWTARIGRLLTAGRLGDLGAEGDGLCNLVYIDDVVEAAIAALTAPDAGGRHFNLALADPPSWNRYLLDFGRAIGATPVNRISRRQLRLETKVLAIPLKLAELVSGKLRFAGGVLPDPLTPGLGRLFGQEARFHSAMADTILGAGKTSYGAGIAASAAWFSRQNPRPAKAA